jgi:hypothetical protein
MGTRDSFPGGKAAVAWSWPLTSTSAEVKEWVELYLHSPNTPSWRGAQLKHRDNFTFTFTFYLYNGTSSRHVYHQRKGVPTTYWERAPYPSFLTMQGQFLVDVDIHYSTCYCSGSLHDYKTLLSTSTSFCLMNTRNHPPIKCFALSGFFSYCSTLIRH